MEYLIAAIISIVGLIGGFFVGKKGSEGASKGKIDEANREASSIVEKAQMAAEVQMKEKEMAGKEKALQIASKAEKDASRITRQAEDLQKKARQKENTINQKTNSLTNKEKEVDKVKAKLEKELTGIEDRKSKLDKKTADLDTKKAELEERKSELKSKQEKLDAQMDKAQTELASKLEKVAGLSAEDAKAQLIETMTKKAEAEAMAHIKDVVDEANLKANKEAKKIIIQTIQRTAAEHAIENSVSVFNLESDDIKGQIIGREGRNIRALEAATGIEIIVDDTPEAVVISGYDPLRREIARLSLHRLVADGRIHPARIEEVVNKTRKQLEQQIIEIGERTVIDMNIHGLHPKLIRLVGKMRFRSSYGQNLLQHSRETANLCAIMASEIGIDEKKAKRAGLLHDIGKVSEENPELSHALLGMELCKKYNEKPDICNAVGAHHDEVEMKYMISPVVQACDAISGSRPGARREMLESYLKRIKALEELAGSYDGVEKAYAIQAGRELRVIVESDQVSDQKAEDLSFEISQKIQSEMQYPGQIKVTVIRERRAISFAK